MNGERGTLTGLVADADVLIDYVQADRTVLLLLGRHLAALHVPSPVLEEVPGLPEDAARRLGIVVVEPTLAQATEAIAGQGATSFQDRLCLIVARDAGWSVFTNDRALRSACSQGGVPCVWGMEAMAILVDGGHLPAGRAMAVAERIARGNPFITQSVLGRFRQRIGL